MESNDKKLTEVFKNVFQEDVVIREENFREQDSQDIDLLKVEHLYPEAGKRMITLELLMKINDLLNLHAVFPQVFEGEVYSEVFYKQVDKSLKQLNLDLNIFIGDYLKNVALHS